MRGRKSRYIRLFAGFLVTSAAMVIEVWVQRMDTEACASGATFLSSQSCVSEISWGELLLTGAAAAVLFGLATAGKDGVLNRLYSEADYESRRWTSRLLVASTVGIAVALLGFGVSAFATAALASPISTVMILVGAIVALSGPIVLTWWGFKSQKGTSSGTRVSKAEER